jgi:hypothetical protein
MIPTFPFHGTKIVQAERKAKFFYLFRGEAYLKAQRGLQIQHSSVLPIFSPSGVKKIFLLGRFYLPGRGTYVAGRGTYVAGRGTYVSRPGR